MVGTNLIGVSPEFEMALYTMYFLVSEEENPFYIDDIFSTTKVTFKDTSNCMSGYTVNIKHGVQVTNHPRIEMNCPSNAALPDTLNSLVDEAD